MNFFYTPDMLGQSSVCDARMTKIKHFDSLCLLL